MFEIRRRPDGRIQITSGKNTFGVTESEAVQIAAALRKVVVNRPAVVHVTRETARRGAELKEAVR
jgi:hypothetical protein